MAIGLIGQKIGMSRVLTDDGQAIAVSVLKLDDAQVIQRKTVERDGYSAIQVTTGRKQNKKGELKTNKLTSAVKGHYAKAKKEAGLGLWEFRVDEDFVADKVDISLFNEGCFVDVAGRSKGKGFQGGVKRHNFSMQDATHGNSLSHRALGSTGQCQFPGRVFKGKKMAGHMGDEAVKAENLEVIKIDVENKLLLVKGAVPGAKKQFVKVYLAFKKTAANEKITAEAEKLKEQEAERIATIAAEKAAKKQAAQEQEQLVLEQTKEAQTADSQVADKMEAVNQSEPSEQQKDMPNNADDANGDEPKT